MIKKYKNGLVLGKFCPPQMGHMFLIDMAVEQCEVVHVMVCSEDCQPIPGQLRAQWVKHIFRSEPSVKVIWCNDDNPQYPDECESEDVFYKKYWVPTVYKYIEELDAVFTSEEYGFEFARYLGVKHEQVDQPRGHYAISATAIRNDPYANWRYIPKSIRPYYTKKIVIMGTESTGKSTLTRKLAYYYNTEYVKEYGRQYAEAKLSEAWNNADFNNIALLHNDYISRKLAKGEKVLFVDTEAITTKIFGEMYLDTFDSTKVDTIIDKQKFDLYFVLDTDVPWVDDGTRLFPHLREQHKARIIKELTYRNIPYILIGGTYHERFEKMIKEIDKLGNLY